MGDTLPFSPPFLLLSSARLRERAEPLVALVPLGWVRIKLLQGNLTGFVDLRQQ